MAESVSGATIQECRMLQSEEYEILQSIYPECLTSATREDTITLEVGIEFSEPRNVILTKKSEATYGICSSRTGDRPEPQTITLSTLPPLFLKIRLAADYPLAKPPCIASLRVEHQWFAQTIQLQEILTRMWQPGDGVLYNWVEFIRTGEFLAEMGVMTTHSINIAHEVPQALASRLTTYDSLIKSTHFAKNIYPCSICLEEHKGFNCVQLSCDHIFCRACLEDFWKLFIMEGDIGRIGCPDPSCVKEGRCASESEVARVVTEEEVRRWRWLKSKKDLEMDPTIIHCPMSFCQTPVSRPPDAIANDDSGWNRLRSCPSCTFSFCAFCRRTWHGPISSCLIPYSEAIVIEYLGLPENSPAREAIESRFGRGNILKLVAAYEQEKLNKAWLETSTTACPGCRVYVEKSLGCNHMTCTKCGQHFCYRCGDKLPPDDPFTHFSTKYIPCYNQLFDMQTGSVDDEMVLGALDHE
ncbi:hypothetical protein BD779DRAFT_1431073 [Infundibulicybe gibba]|nr:hypothetical protein BD779DRAFT_1431073 [Infundibulicybe gibba]